MKSLLFFIPLLLVGCVKEDVLILGKKTKEPLILFEEFLCPACQTTISSDFEFFIKKYVENGPLSILIIPTAFFESSRPSFAAFHQINQYHPALLYPFFLFIYSLPQEELQQLSIKEILTKFHTIHPSFSIDHLMNSLDEEMICKSIETNCSLLEKFYDEEMHLPTYIYRGKTIPGGNLLEVLIDSSL